MIARPDTRSDETALAAGASDNGPPGFRSAAFVTDPDGHNIEAACQSPE